MTRTRLAPGIYRDASGIAAEVAVGTRPRLNRKGKRFPPGTTIRDIKHWQERTRIELRDVPNKPKGSLTKDIDTYLDQVRYLESWVERRSTLRAWTRRYPALSRRLLTTTKIRAAVNEWRDQGVAPKTINHRLQALRHLYRVLDGKRAYTPVDDVDPLPVPRTPPTIVQPSVVLMVVENLSVGERKGTLRNAKTRARFMVLASTGTRPSELKRAVPADVDLERRVWQVRNGKGGWSPGVYLNNDMMAAWHVFIEADAWGSFETNSYVRVLRTAGWPKGVRPYTLRHSLGIAASEQGRDLADISAHLGHTRPQTTRSHYVPVLGTRLQELSEAIDGRFGW